MSVRVKHEEAPGADASVDLVDAREGPDEVQAPASLRPQSFEDYVGQAPLIDKLRVYVEAATQRKEPLDHVLLHGPPGLGKTTLAQIIANEMGARLHTTSGPAIEHKGVLAGLLTGLEAREVLFIDEIHRLSPTVEETLYSAMEDGRIDIPMGEGSSANTMSISLAPFTLVGATTRTALLSAPLRDRFHIVEGLEFYEDEELARIVTRTAALLGLPATAEGAHEIGRRSRGTPRIANRLTRRVRDFVQVDGSKRIERESAARHLDRLQVDAAGLNRHDRRILEIIIDSFGGGPVGVEALAASLGTPRDTLEDVHEPFLLQRGFLIRTPRGRMTTARAATHIGHETAGEEASAARARGRGGESGGQTTLL